MSGAVRLTLLGAGLLGLSSLAIGAGRDRPHVPVVIQGDLQIDPCSNGVVVGLNPHGDGFLSVRSGPGTRYRELGRLYNGQQVYICAERGAWLGIVFERPWRTGCNVTTPWPETQPYTGPCRSGWVHRRWVKLWAG
jgi:hypothetical protein